MTTQRDFAAMEARWRPFWQEIDLYRTGDDPAQPTHYILDYFPYPSGHGLSVGHCRNYVPTCISARYMRMTGHNVLHPMGWDAFGLPAENFAIAHGVHPRETTARQADTYRRQLTLAECSYDWSREINSADPAYYRWTQWFFKLLFDRGLAYRAAGEQWYCPDCRTILANEQVEQGRCWRCDSVVERKSLQQWYFRITAYADRLLDDLEKIDWPEHIKGMQRNWIGRSSGAEIDFTALTPAGATTTIPVFTTRADTLFGVTFLALAPEHPLTGPLTAPAQRPLVDTYVDAARRRSHVERQTSGRAQTGIYTGSDAIHPVTGRRIPIYVADYVLTDYGSGAVMGVPAHDARDFAFANTYVLPIVETVRPDRDDAAADVCFTGDGVLVESGPYSGMTSAAARAALTTAMEADGWGRAVVRTRLSDWLISRQRYWGAPIPIIHCPTCGPVAVPERDLPVRLPDVDDYQPAGDGRSALARVESWVETACPDCGAPARRETDTMDGFACSSWYFLRFASPHYDQGAFDPREVARWLPVDVYVGGAEHAVLHLLYARFWTKVMFDAGLIDFDEPFSSLRNQGVLHAADGRRMSKSRGNVITPDSVVARYGSDVLRTYVVFLGPFEANVTWDEAGIKGVVRFLDRVWQLAQEKGAAAAAAPIDRAFRRRRHETIARVTGDMEAFKFNTAVAALMGWLNELEAARRRPIAAGQWQDAVTTMALLLAPIAPFIAESIWRDALGREGSVHRQPWPAADEAALVQDTVTVAVQVDGRLRGTVAVPAGCSSAALEAAALGLENVRRHVDGKAIRRAVVIPDRLVNIVTG